MAENKSAKEELGDELAYYIRRLKLKEEECRDAYLALDEKDHRYDWLQGVTDKLQISWDEERIELEDHIEDLETELEDAYDVFMQFKMELVDSKAGKTGGGPENDEDGASKGDGAYRPQMEAQTCSPIALNDREDAFADKRLNLADQILDSTRDFLLGQETWNRNTIDFWAKLEKMRYELFQTRELRQMDIALAQRQKELNQREAKLEERARVIEKARREATLPRKKSESRSDYFSRPSRTRDYMGINHPVISTHPNYHIGPPRNTVLYGDTDSTRGEEVCDSKEEEGED